MSLLINCFFLGDRPDQMFTVKALKNENVSILKKLIKEEKVTRMKDIEASDLILWKVKFPFDNLKEELAGFEPDSHPMLLPVSRLSIFEGVADDDIHVIAKVPEAIPHVDPIQLLSLNCFILGDSPDRIFTVEIQKTKNVSILKKLIKEENPSSLGNVNTKDIDLWQVEFPIDNPPDLLADGPKLRSEMLLSNIFPAGLDINHVHVVAHIPVKESRVINEGDEGDEGRDQISGLNNRFKNVISSISKAMAPSDSAKSSTYPKSQIVYSIYDGRYKDSKPRASVAPPIQLFQPAFAHFLDDIKGTDAIPDDIICKTTEYMKAASAIYASEEDRQAALTPLLCAILGINIQRILNGDKTNADGVVELLTDLGSFLLYLQEDKNEFGDAGSDPSTQAGLSAGRYWAQPKYERYRNTTNCPTFLVATAGPWIAILGTVLTDGLIVQRLTDYIWVGLDCVISEAHILRVGRTLYALKNGLYKLQSYYMAVQLPGVSPSALRYFPSTSSYRDDKERVHFTYVGFLENIPDCMTLRAKTLTEPCRDIVVKFVNRYGARAHKLLADDKLAPKLLYCGSPHFEREDPSYESLTMVVMEFVDGKTLARSKMDRNAAEVVQKKIKRALDLLHGNGLVFGDLRSPNVMITAATEVKLIDFDWAREKGQAKYPYLISPELPWSAGVKALAIIEAKHDLQMLEKIFSGSVPFITDN